MGINVTKSTLKQIIISGLVSIVLAVIGFFWLLLVIDSGGYKTIIDLADIISFDSRIILSIEMALVLGFVCWISFRLNISRFVKVFILYLFTPPIAVIIAGLMAYCSEPVKVLVKNNGLLFYVLFICVEFSAPVYITVNYYLKNHRDKIPEIITMSLIYAFMCATYYTGINAMVLGCVFFGNCM